MGTPKVRSTCAWLGACSSGVNENSHVSIRNDSMRAPVARAV